MLGSGRNNLEKGTTCLDVCSPRTPDPGASYWMLFGICDYPQLDFSRYIYTQDYLYAIGNRGDKFFFNNSTFAHGGNDICPHLDRYPLTLNCELDLDRNAFLIWCLRPSLWVEFEIKPPVYGYSPFALWGVTKHPVPIEIKSYRPALDRLKPSP